jgi:hypothetical protein
MLYRLTLAATVAGLLAGCAGGMNPAPTALAPNGQTMAPNGNWDSRPDASGCFRRNRFVREDRLVRGGVWNLNPRSGFGYVSVIVRNGLRNVTINFWPASDPSAVTAIRPGKTRVITVKTPSGVSIQEAMAMNDNGPGVRVNGKVCPTT